MEKASRKFWQTHRIQVLFTTVILFKIVVLVRISNQSIYVNPLLTLNCMILIELVFYLQVKLVDFATNVNFRVAKPKNLVAFAKKLGRFCDCNGRNFDPSFLKIVSIYTRSTILPLWEETRQYHYY